MLLLHQVSLPLTNFPWKTNSSVQRASIISFTWGNNFALTACRIGASTANACDREERNGNLTALPPTTFPLTTGRSNSSKVLVRQIWKQFAYTRASMTKMLPEFVESAAAKASDQLVKMLRNMLFHVNQTVTTVPRGLWYCLSSRQVRSSEALGKRLQCPLTNNRHPKRGLPLKGQVHDIPLCRPCTIHSVLPPFDHIILMLLFPLLTTFLDPLQLALRLVVLHRLSRTTYMAVFG